MRILYYDKNNNGLLCASEVTDVFPEEGDGALYNLVMCDPFTDGGYYVVKDMLLSEATDKVREAFNTGVLNLTKCDVEWNSDVEVKGSGSGSSDADNDQSSIGKMLMDAAGDSLNT